MFLQTYQPFSLDNEAVCWSNHALSDIMSRYAKRDSVTGPKGLQLALATAIQILHRSK